VRIKLDDGTYYPLAGRFEFAESNVNETTGTLQLRATFPNPDRILLPGMFVRAVLQTGVAEGSFLVPQRAVTRNAKGEPTALFVKADGTVESRILKLNGSVGNNWLAETGVGDGDRVIVEGLQRARVGQKAIAVETTIDETTGEIREVKQRGADAAPESTPSAPRKN
jgi:membrane fusion protein, multidrug efflux system